MHLLTLLTLLTCLLLTSTSSASRQNITFPFIPPTHSSVTRRWYSIPTPLNNAIPAGWGPWPALCPSQPTHPQPLRYCFADTRSQTTLQPIVNEAAARWVPAIAASKMTIALDNDESPVCDWSKNRADTLVISDATREGDEEWNWEGCESETTTGYAYGSEERGRHALVFCELKPGMVGETRGHAVRSMMHELGHAMGLTHEHQRADRGEYLWFYCRRLQGYKELKEKDTLMIDPKAIFEEDATEKQRFELVCQIQEYAQAYLPDALPYIKGDNMVDPRFASYQYSNEFDFDSIMMYNSYPGGGKVGTSKDWVLTRKSDGSAVWMGGEQDPTKASISEGDVARIAQLYGGSTEQQDLGKWSASDFEVKIRDELEMVVPPARKRKSEL